jgi:DNA invertase Pin-like site-specific DNA recombinase
MTGQHGGHRDGAGRRPTITTEALLAEARRLIAEGNSQRRTARILGVRQSTLSRALRR